MLTIAMFGSVAKAGERESDGLDHFTTSRSKWMKSDDILSFI